MRLIILHTDGSVEKGDVDLSQTSDTPSSCRLKFSSPRRKTLVFENDDFFECLVDLRRALEPEGAKVLCNGARKDVFPSPMGRRTAGGLQAYRQKLGQKALNDDIVDIFAKAESGLIGTVDEQRAFNEQWLMSLGWQKSRSGKWFMTDPDKAPLPGEIEEAKRFPNGTVSRIGGGFDADDAVPPQAIEGCWEVDMNGQIVGSFLRNPHYDPEFSRQ